MTYELVVPRDIRRQIGALPVADQAELLVFFDRLQADPDQATGTFGLDMPAPVRMKTAGLSRFIVAVLIDDPAERVTAVRIEAPFAD
ncbi:hypothetical protein [Streptomyces sp. NPDC029674]|uniref:hypothetical protein n=1 Tax=Streptomyces sp. NPDC029674 TaxID=3365297 RepID=UPI003850AC1E